MLAERRAQLSFDQGRPDDALAILQVTPFQLLHQRYARSDLFRQISGLQVRVPDSLGEDDLAIWGAYREHEPS